MASGSGAARHPPAHGAACRGRPADAIQPEVPHGPDRAARVRGLVPRNPDGSFTMHFGYFNRNFVEEVHVPVGPDNHFDPGEPDSGQPTFFHPRAQRRAFSVRVPADFGDRRLVWNLTTQGQTLRAIGWLEATWETAARAAGGRRLSEEAARNRAPAIAVDTPPDAAVQSEVTLRARVTDDGLPVVRDIDPADRAPGNNEPPTLQPGSRRPGTAAQRPVGPGPAQARAGRNRVSAACGCRGSSGGDPRTWLSIRPRPSRSRTGGRSCRRRSPPPATTCSGRRPTTTC